MRWVFSFIIAIHGLIHLMGLVKAFGIAQLPQLTLPISRGMGVVWLAAALLCLASVAAVFAWPRGWWTIGLAAVVVSQTVIVTAWSDAKVGTVANLVLLLGVAYGYLTQGPLSFRAQFERDATTGIARPLSVPVVTEADLGPLPEPVQRYLRATGMVGQPRIRNYRLRFRGRIRSGPDARWMPFVAEQHSFADEPTRLFLMDAAFLGAPVQAFHRLTGGHATMRVKAVGAVPIADASGAEMDRAETVTLFNDMSVLAPGTLIEPSIVWGAVDARAAKARFTNGGNTIAAMLYFDEEGLLTNFISDDRSRSTPDAKAFVPQRFSTPVLEYRRFGPYRLAARAEARWHPPEGEFAYGEFELLDVAYNVRKP
jgi:hypothetical protein